MGNPLDPLTETELFHRSGDRLMQLGARPPYYAEGWSTEDYWCYHRYAVPAKRKPTLPGWAHTRLALAIPGQMKADKVSDYDAEHLQASFKNKVRSGNRFPTRPHPLQEGVAHTQSV